MNPVMSIPGAYFAMFCRYSCISGVLLVRGSLKNVPTEIRPSHSLPHWSTSICRLEPPLQPFNVAPPGVGLPMPRLSRAAVRMHPRKALVAAGMKMNSAPELAAAFIWLEQSLPAWGISVYPFSSRLKVDAAVFHDSFTGDV